MYKLQALFLQPLIVFETATLWAPRDVGVEAASAKSACVIGRPMRTRNSLCFVELEFTVFVAEALLVPNLVAYIVLHCEILDICQSRKVRHQHTEKNPRVFDESIGEGANGVECVRTDLFAKDLGGAVQGTDEDAGELAFGVCSKDKV